MKIVLIGYGKMGKIIESVALERNHSIAARIDVNNIDDLKKIKQLKPDVAIEFTHPESAFENIRQCLEQGVPVISGTTGWLSAKKEIEELCERKNGTFFYASNFSVGVNIVFRINEILAKIMNAYPIYEPGIVEIHHTEKKDAPSGTGITLADGIIQHMERKKSWVNKKSDEITTVNIESIRLGKVAGVHVVRYLSEFDEIEIRHEALSRKGFAIGAVLVAEWIKDKKGVLSMKDFLEI